MDPKNVLLRVNHLLSERSGLKEFLREFVQDLPPSLAQFIHAYVAGQLTIQPPKSLSRLADAMGVSEGHLRKMLSDEGWDEEKLSGILFSRVRRVHARRPRGVIFEQICRKSGFAIPGSEIQYSEETGKSLRSLSLTNLVLVEREFSCILESDPFLPTTWMEDDHRRAAAGIPQDQSYSPKWKSALRLVNRAKEKGIAFDWLVLGRSYGAEVALLEALSENSQRFIAEVPESLRGWLYHPWVATGSRGYPRAQRLSDFPGDEVRPAHSLKELTAGMTRKAESLDDGWFVADPVQGWQARILSFYADLNGLPSSPLGLLVLRNSSLTQCRYFVSNGSLGVSLENLAELALSKDRVEKSCRDLALGVGLADFKLRNFPALQRHLVLSTLSMLFRSEGAVARAGNRRPEEGLA